jgi:spermidine synthase
MGTDLLQRRWGVLPLYLGVFTTSMAGLVLEIALTRMFSVSLWHHLAFMVISTALLGFGASGAFLSISNFAFQHELHRVLALLSGLFSFSVLISLALMIRVPLDPLAINEPRHILYLLAYYALVLLPFFFAGLTLGTALSRMAGQIGSLYFADLIGAGLGCLIVVGALSVLPGQGAVLLAAFLAALASLFYSFLATRTLSILALVLIVGLGALIPQADSLFPLYIPRSKLLGIALNPIGHPELRILYTGWNPFSRIDVIWEPNQGGYVWGLSKHYGGYTPEQISILIDAAALTTVNRFNGDLAELEFTNYMPSSLAYQIAEQPSVLIIGPGGGLDVLAAFRNGASPIVGVEINPLIVDLMKGQFDDFAGGLYTVYPQIDIHIAEGRNFVRRSTDAYGVIQLSQVDTFAAASSAAYSLSENYLYTVEAFEGYYDHLNDDGYLTISRWYFEPPVQALRLVTIGATALEHRGVKEPWRHFVVVRSEDISTVMMKKTPFHQTEIARLQELCADRGFEILYVPGTRDKDSPFVGFLTSSPSEAFYRQIPFDVKPTTDDRPFFFEYYGWQNLGYFRSGKFTLIVILLQALLLSIGLILLPLWLLRRAELRTHGRWHWLIYFGCLGIGFIFIEVVLMQQLVLYLGHPTASISVVLFSLLSFSGLGSFISGRLQGNSRRYLRVAIPALGAMGLIYTVILSPLALATLAWDFPWRVALSVILLAPLGLVMGMPFPLGIRLVDSFNNKLIPWAWGVNGCASVLGSILSVIIAMTWGFSTVLVLSALVYQVALVSILTLKYPSSLTRL